MIGQRPVKLTAAQEKHAYEVATERDGGRCQRCGRVGTVERDHRQGRDAYNTVPSNLQCLCPGCHRWKTEHPQQAILDGFGVSRWARPTLWPAWRVAVGWVLYDDEGGWQEISQATADLLMNGGA
ncbi:MAG TPA: HNH endonuclease signature motif containing protein [Microbacterium sp.]|nr:HNH endonuclease signature motif containing protein [Microbacterium sp.]